MTDKSHLDDTLDHRITDAYLQGQAGEPMTVASIEAERWNAVYRPLPANASAELLKAVNDAAAQCIGEAHQAVRDAQSPGSGFKTNEQWVEQTGQETDPAKHFEAHYLRAVERFDDTTTRLSVLRYEQSKEQHQRDDILGRDFLAYTKANHPAFHEGLGDTHPEASSDDHAAAIGRDIRLGEGFMKWNHTPAIVDPWNAAREGEHSPGQKAQESQQQDSTPIHPNDFRAVAEATTQTRQDHRERDLADVTKQLAQTGGRFRETPVHAAFLRDQNERGAEISRTAPPDQRQELRNEREAVAHEYAGQLAERIAGAAGLSGQRETSDELKRFAGIQREIATAIREPEKTPPGKSREEIRQDFSADAAEVGRNIGMGQSARTIHIDERGPARPQDATPSLLSPSEPQRPEPTLTRGVSVGVGPGGATLVEINQDRPDVRAVAEPPHDERAEKNEAELLTRQAAESTKRQESEQDALAGRDSANGKAVDPVRQATLAALREHKESMGDRDGGNDGRTFGRPITHTRQLSAASAADKGLESPRKSIHYNATC